MVISRSVKGKEMEGESKGNTRKEPFVLKYKGTNLCETYKKCTALLSNRRRKRPAKKYSEILSKIEKK